MNTLSNFIEHLLCTGHDLDTVKAVLNKKLKKKKLAKYFVAMEIIIVPKVLNSFI